MRNLPCGTNHGSGPRYGHRMLAAGIVFVNAVLGLAASGTADAPEAVPEPPPTRAPATDRAVVDALGRPVSVAFIGVPLEQALRRVGQAAGAPVAADWKWLEAAGFARNDPVTLR